VSRISRNRVKHHVTPELEHHPEHDNVQCPRDESNVRTRFRKPLLYPLSYGGGLVKKETSTWLKTSLGDEQGRQQPIEEEFAGRGGRARSRRRGRGPAWPALLGLVEVFLRGDRAGRWRVTSDPAAPLREVQGEGVDEQGLQVVPSVLSEALGMVAAEGAAAGALPLVARHSGLAEVADAFETEVSRPGLFSFEPGESSLLRLAQGIERLLALAPDEREELRLVLSAFVGREWTWERTASRILSAPSSTVSRAPGYRHHR